MSSQIKRKRKESFWRENKKNCKANMSRGLSCHEQSNDVEGFLAAVFLARFESDIVPAWG